MIYNSGSTMGPRAVTPPLELDYLGAGLFACSVVPVLVGLSLAGNRYPWLSWQALLPVALGSLLLLLFVSRELHPSLACITLKGKSQKHKLLLLSVRQFRNANAAAVFMGALFLGMAVRSSLIFLQSCCLTIIDVHTFVFSPYLLSRH
jgi:hypothetical protein